MGAVPPPAKKRGRGGLVAAVLVTALVTGVGAGAGGAWWGANQATSGETGAPTSSDSGVDPEAPVNVPDQGVPQVAATVLPSTVTIVVDDGDGGTGSGFLLDDQGHIATNNHVVEAAASGTVGIMFPDGTTGSATVVGRSPSYDVAVIRLDGEHDAPPVALGDSDAVQVGQPTVAIGSPLGLGGTVTSGIVSATDRPLSVGDATNADAAQAYINGIQTDAAINPGNSGGPLVNGHGEVIGINSAILTMGRGADQQGGNIGVGFAIPIKQAKGVIDEILETGQATYPIIGATVSEAATGVSIVDVVGSGPAESAGITAGDAVTAVDGKPIHSVTDFIVRVRTHRPGDEVSLSVEGRGEVTVTLGSQVG